MSWWVCSYFCQFACLCLWVGVLFVCTWIIYWRNCIELVKSSLSTRNIKITTEQLTQSMCTSHPIQTIIKVIWGPDMPWHEASGGSIPMIIPSLHGPILPHLGWYWQGNLSTPRAVRGQQQHLPSRQEWCQGGLTALKPPAKLYLVRWVGKAVDFYWGGGVILQSSESCSWCCLERNNAVHTSHVDCFRLSMDSGRPLCTGYCGQRGWCLYNFGVLCLTLFCQFHVVRQLLLFFLAVS